MGAAISFSTSSNSADETNVAQDPFTLQYGYAQGVTTTVDGPSSTTFGIGILAGADYYFVDHIYLGIEGGLGFSTTSDGERTSTTVVAQPGFQQQLLLQSLVVEVNQELVTTTMQVFV